MTPRIVLILVVFLIVLSLFWLAFSLSDNAGEPDAVPRVDSPWVAAVAVPPTTAPTTTTTARARTAPTVRAAQAAPARVYPVGELQDMIRAGFARFGPDVAEQAVRVAGCESTGDSSGQRLNPNATGSQGEVGLLQLHPKYQSGRAAKFGWTMRDLYDPAKNIVVAADLFAQSGWRPWSCRTAAA